MEFHRTCKNCTVHHVCFFQGCISHSKNDYPCGWNSLFEKQMNRIKIFLSSVQNEFAIERRRIADYIRQDTMPEFHQDDFRVVVWQQDKKGVQEKVLYYYLYCVTNTRMSHPTLSTPS